MLEAVASYSHAKWDGFKLLESLKSAAKLIAGFEKTGFTRFTPMAVRDLVCSRPKRIKEQTIINR